MRVYEQIEQLSKTPKVRRSKSITRTEKSSRTSSPHPEMSPAKARLSSDAPAMATSNGSTTGNHGSRSSFEKTRAMKMFKANSRTSIDGDSSPGHKRTNSVVSEKSSRHTPTPMDEPYPYEDDALQQEFDDLMRSSSTMKVSLTPDRLKTMEAYKQEKERGNRRPPVSFKPESDLPQPPPPPPPPRATGRRSSIYRVDSIKEDDEEGASKPPLPLTRNRQASVSSPPTTSPPPSRVRSVSTSSPSTHPMASVQNRRHVNMVQGPSFPPRTRKIQRNRESLDLDDVMAGSDDEEIAPPAAASKTPVKATPKRNGQHVSASTRDLIDFLSAGPPPDAGGSLVDIGADGLPYGSSQNGKPKGTGRLQRMISKLSLSNGERSRGADDFAKSPQQTNRPFPSKPSLNNLSSLANRPIPPRPPQAPRPISPPASHDSFEEHSYAGSRSRSVSLVQKRSPLEANNRGPVPVPSIPAVPDLREHGGRVSSNLRPNGHVQNLVNGNTHQVTNTNGSTEITSPQRLVEIIQTSDISLSSYGVSTSAAKLRSKPTTPTSPIRKPPPVYVDPSVQPHLSRDDAHHIHRLISRATTADECRLILDMFLARAGIPVDPKKYNASNPSPSPSTATSNPMGPVEKGLEATLLELFLGGGSAMGPNSLGKNSQALPADPESPYTENGAPVPAATGNEQIFERALKESSSTKSTNVPEAPLQEMIPQYEV
ncbi:hypothetical protein H0H87_000757 [Tephrocybe sp. NHM501043]|nr:hypothetical protein H0H87_000757 [Tephrocybe sp. NHM501043]